MSELIQWPRAKYWDKPWNPVIGCKPVSPGCANCYARALVTGRWNLTGICSPDFTPTFKPKSKIPKHGVIFCGNMTDLFGEWVAENHLYCRRFSKEATYLWLTKRVRNMIADLRSVTGCEWFDHENHFFGFTAENQRWWNRRVEELTGFPWWAHAWVSLEPLLGPIDLSSDFFQSPLLKWVVVGCESGRGRRPCKVEWVESIVEECRNAGVPVFVKQLDIGGRCVTDIEKFPEHLRIRQVPWSKKGKE